MSAAKMSRWFNVVYVRGFLKLSHDTITAYIDPSGSTVLWSSSIKYHMSSVLMPNWWDLWSSSRISGVAPLLNTASVIASLQNSHSSGQSCEHVQHYLVSLYHTCGLSFWCVLNIRKNDIPLPENEADPTYKCSFIGNTTCLGIINYCYGWDSL